MGVSADLYNERMRGPEPDQGDEVVMALAVAMRGKHTRHEVRRQRVALALTITDDIEGETCYVG